MRRWAEIFTAVVRLLVVLAVALIGMSKDVAQAQAAVRQGPDSATRRMTSGGALRYLCCVPISRCGGLGVRMLEMTG